MLHVNWFFYIKLKLRVSSHRSIVITDEMVSIWLIISKLSGGNTDDELFLNLILMKTDKTSFLREREIYIYIHIRSAWPASPTFS